MLLILPPDLSAPGEHRHYRFPPQGPALVAASLREEGVEVRLVDLELVQPRRALPEDLLALRDDRVARAHLMGAPDARLTWLVEEILDRVEVGHCDAIGFSLARHTQIWLAALLGQELKRRTGLPVVLGGASADVAQRLLAGAGVRGIDVATFASTPVEIRAAVRALREMGRGRFELPVEVAVRAPVDPGDWPLPDFGVYDLGAYRIDPIEAARHQFLGYDGSVGVALVLPYHFSWDCQFRCAFCQRGGRQIAKSMDRVVRDLATLTERHDVSDFVLFDAQINLHATALAKALIAARLGVRWCDSYRVAPSAPGVMELLARSGCAGLTFGVESASDRMLKKMTKGHRSVDATRVVRAAHAVGIFTRVNLLPCFPGETGDDFAATRDWLEHNATAIDDIAPSAFYLAPGSPVGQDPERYGIRLRGPRTLQGDEGFRKNLETLEYDEIGGRCWEERAATFRLAEQDLREAWARGRREALARLGGMPVGMMLGLRRVFTNKAEAQAALVQWLDGPPAAAGRAATEGTRPPVAAPAPVEEHCPDVEAPGSVGVLTSATLACTEDVHRLLGGLRPGDVIDGWHVVAIRGPSTAAFEVEVGRSEVVFCVSVSANATSPHRPYRRTRRYDFFYGALRPAGVALETTDRDRVLELILQRVARCEYQVPPPSGTAIT